MRSSSRALLSSNALTTAMLVVGLVNNVAIAAIFGLTRRVDAFYAALMLPNLFMVLCLDYLGKNFMPAFARAKKEGDRFASELTSSIVTIMSIAAAGIAVLLALSSPYLFGLLLPGFSSEDVELVTRYFWIMAPSFVLMAATVFNQHVCQYNERYVQITAIRSALPLANLAAIVVASPLIGEYALPVGHLLGHLVVFLLMAREAEYRHIWRVTVRREWEGRIFSNSAIVAGSGLLARIRPVIMNYFASLLGSGAIAAIALSSRLTEPLGRTIFTAVRMIMFSRTARYAADGNSRQIARLYDLGLASSFLLLAPLLWWIGLYSGVIVEVVFVRGEFDREMAALVSLALLGTVPGIAFVGINAIMSNAFYAMDRIAVPAIVMPIGTVLYLAVAPYLSARYGVLGLTAGESLASAAIFFVMVVLLRRQVPAFRTGKSVGRLLRYTAIAGLCFVGAKSSADALGLSEIASGALSLGLGGALYLVVLGALRDSTLAFVGGYLRRAAPAARLQ